MVRRWLMEAGCERIFVVNNLTGEGIPELRAYLNRDTRKMTLDEVIERQSKGLKDWDI
jgi:ethanolamine utilization protein EutP